MKKDQKNEFSTLMNTIKYHVEQVFANQNREADRKNEEQRTGNLRKDEKAEKIYIQLQDVSK